MKTQMSTFLLLAVVTSVVRAQTPAEPNYEDFILNLKLPLDNYRPLLNQVQVEMIHTEDGDPAMSVRSLTFPAQETECGSTQGEQCPLKEDGKLMECNIKVTFPIQEVDDIRGFDMRCDMTTEETLLKKVRTRRSTYSSGSGQVNTRGDRRRPGGRGRPKGRGRLGSFSLIKIAKKPVK